MSTSTAPERLDVAIVGGGFGGLYAVYAFRKLGLTVLAFEAGPDVGGTWFWNKYPGARCDLESLDYSYSFSDELQQDWNWSERYGGQPEILEYINHVADRFDLRRSVRLNTRVTAATYLDAESEWLITTEHGNQVRARYFVVAAGMLSKPFVPLFPGLDGFKGEWYHSGRWPAEPVQFDGKRVGVIGTGSSGIQMIPIIAQAAGHLTVFQRTPNFCLPAGNAPMDKEHERTRKAGYAAHRLAALGTSTGIVVDPPTLSALDVAPEARTEAYEALWRRGGSIAFLSLYKDLLTNKDANDTAAEFVRGKIRGIVKDPATAALLTPTGYPLGTKRLCLATNYFETYNRDNVSLVDVGSDPIREITATGLKTENASFELDVIVFATGYDAMTGALREIDVRGENGKVLREHWEGGPLTYLGVMTSGFPNMFIVAGPGSPAAKTQFVAAIEQHVDLIARTITHMQAEGIARIEAEEKAEADWVAHVNEVAKATLFPLANSWYLGANIPGKPRVFMPYVGGFHRYIAACEDALNDNFRGFSLSGRQDGLV